MIDTFTSVSKLAAAASCIPGATDLNIGLYKNEDSTYELMGEGRDIAEFDYRVSFDKEYSWAWQLEGEARDLRREEAEASIIEAITILERAEASEIAKQTGTSRQTVGTHLKRMRDYDNSPITYEVKGKKIYYTLSIPSKPSDIQHLLNLQDNIKEGTEGELKGITVRAYSKLPEGHEGVLPASPEKPCLQCGTDGVWVLVENDNTFTCSKCGRYCPQ